MEAHDMRIQTVIDCMVALAPPRLAESWDNVGLMVGNPAEPLRGVTVALDPTLEAVEAALAHGSNLLVTHHPLLFKPPRSLDLRSEPGRTVAALIRGGCALYAAHTNLDVTAVNHALAEKLGVVPTGLMHRTGEQALYKVAVQVPEARAEAIREAVWQAGGGASERYDRSAYSWATEGTFRPLPGASPAVGEVGAQARTSELRLEFLVSAERLGAVRTAVLAAHPYEAPALDVVALHGAGQPEGFGLVGDLAAPERLEALARRACAALGLPAVRLVGPPTRLVRRVCWLGGSGGDYWRDALAVGADVYVTGEVRHHAALDALAAGLSLVEVGHVGSEQPVVPWVAEHLQRALGATVPVHALHQIDPLRVVVPAVPG
ncbi:MAG: Nif3-like dinuclear metal center hexameric protein [Candidatus Sericytochromatia bacterium]|nr:Nif3-like dinuclear metal center hexameric protein [Candidatus Sericytochromatia bacterium]